jgi:hypothetical protein
MVVMETTKEEEKAGVYMILPLMGQYEATRKRSYNGALVWGVQRLAFCWHIPAVERAVIALAVDYPVTLLVRYAFLLHHIFIYLRRLCTLGIIITGQCK